MSRILDAGFVFNFLSLLSVSWWHLHSHGMPDKNKDRDKVRGATLLCM